jgi:hypothetical protein
LFASLFLVGLSLNPDAFVTGSVSFPGVIPPLPIQYAQIALSLVYWVMPFLRELNRKPEE